MPRAIRSAGSLSPTWFTVKTPPVTSARPTVPGPSGVVVTASIATVPCDALIVEPTGSSLHVCSWAWIAGSVDEHCVVAGAISTRPASGATVKCSSAGVGRAKLLRPEPAADPSPGPRPCGRRRGREPRCLAIRRHHGDLRSPGERDARPRRATRTGSCLCRTEWSAAGGSCPFASAETNVSRAAASAGLVRVGEPGAVGRPGRVSIGARLLHQRPQATALLVDGERSKFPPPRSLANAIVPVCRPGGLAVDSRGRW